MMDKSLGMRYRDKVAIITGSSRGIGLGIAERMLKEGASVVVSSRKPEGVAKAVSYLQGCLFAVEQHRVLGFPCHVGKPEDRKKLVEFTLANFGCIDVFVSNVAISPATGPLMATEERLWAKMFQVNVSSAFFAAKEAIPHMSKGSSICFTSSIGGYIPFPSLGVYSISKTAVIGLTRCLAEELSGQGIRVNCIAPGVIKTGFSEMLWKKGNEERVHPNALIQRNGTVEDCAAAVAYLCSEDASFVTGETLPVTGGVRSRL